MPVAKYHVIVKSENNKFARVFDETVELSKTYEIKSPVTVTVKAVDQCGEESSPVSISLNEADLAESPTLSCPVGKAGEDLQTVDKCNCCQVDGEREDGAQMKRHYSCNRAKISCVDKPDEECYKCSGANMCSLMYVMT